MITSELTGKSVPPYEQEILDFLSSDTFDGGGNTMVIAVENQEKEVYRVMKVSGMGDFMNVIGFLWDIGLTDILENSTKAVNGFDAIFRFEQTVH